MLKSDLILKMCAMYPRLYQQDPGRIVNIFVDEIIEAFKDGGRVEFRGFGALTTKARDGRIGRNPRVSGLAGNFVCASADHQRARARQVAQCFKHTLRAQLLHDRDEDGKARERREYQCLSEAAEQQTDDAACHQQGKHGLAEHVEGDAQEVAAALPRQFAGDLRPEPASCFLVAQPLLSIDSLEP
jgi:integration host factor subunit beta